MLLFVIPFEGTSSDKIEKHVDQFEYLFPYFFGSKIFGSSSSATNHKINIFMNSLCRSKFLVINKL